MAYRCSHPEVELKALDIFNTKSDRDQHNTLLDLLDVYPDWVVWAPKLDHARLVEHFRRMESIPSKRNEVPPLRMLQVSLERFVLQALIDIAVSSKPSLTSAKMMIQNCTPTQRHTGCTSDSGCLPYSSERYSLEISLETPVSSALKEENGFLSVLPLFAAILDLPQSMS
ncbi:hypothetical protein JR316_0004150 [Psilocybe cubensis]|uniref:Uncharacterized protein n=3 Tax=Psilocybe cubensis TaxID=181762 RepID=A0A8H7XVF2_PSICU|nr:hypothetical protein JR316_0004145 [Psilocybe cubensis]XP_047749680.1 hypothetical protein JR316_0004150 [Psilocybe cubensis]KAH9482050.1 hypothetical protein JR316_0004145 [Psilocybe cubensis]KAH9482055.1 hypothetical protein JR316_0004150 [Psilocybe cubensis]